MKIHIINQEPLEVNADQAKSIMKSVTSGAEVVIIGHEMVKASAITGIRISASETIPASQWGALPAGKMEHFFDDKRENPGKGYRKFQEMKSKFLRGNV